MSLAVKLLLVVLSPSLLLLGSGDDLHVYVQDESFLFAKDVSELSKLDLHNGVALLLEHNKIYDRERLKKGTGKTGRTLRGGSREVHLEWLYRIDDSHIVANYSWEWIAGSSSQSEIVQVFHFSGNEVFVTQQIKIDMHHGGGAVGAYFNFRRKLLLAKAVAYGFGEGRCCPSLMDIVTFRWDGERFRRVNRQRVPLLGTN